jgi:hypothetical protein
MVEIKEGGPKWKGTVKHRWRARNCMKNTLRSFIFKKLLYVYNLDPLNFFKKSILIYKFIFVIFQSLIREMREIEGLLDSGDKRESQRSLHFRSLKYVFLVSWSFMRWKGFYGGCLKPWYCLKNKIWVEKPKTKSVWFQVFGPSFKYLELMKWFVGVLRMLVKYFLIEVAWKLEF